VPVANGSATENINETEQWLALAGPFSFRNRLGFRKKLKIKFLVFHSLTFEPHLHVFTNV
jgi:hypothetical protein